MNTSNTVRRPVKAGDYGLDIPADISPKSASDHGSASAKVKKETDGQKTLGLWSN